MYTHLDIPTNIRTRTRYSLRTISGNTAFSSVSSAKGLFNQPATGTAAATVIASYHDVYFDFGNAFRPFTQAPGFRASTSPIMLTQQFFPPLQHRLPTAPDLRSRQSNFGRRLGHRCALPGSAETCSD